MAGESLQTTNHDTIRHWAEERGAVPAYVKGTEDNDGGIGVLRFDFREGERVDEELQPISWDEFFETFDKKNLAMLYQETTNEGAESRFFKFVENA